MKNVIGDNVIVIELNLLIAMDIIVIFTRLILPIQECDLSLHLLVSSFISFITILQFSEYRPFASVGRLFLSILFFMM